MSQALATTTNQTRTIAQILQDPATAEAFKARLPATVNQDRFLRIVKDALNANPDLRNCKPQSVMDACAKAAKDGLVIDGREAALVVFKGSATYIPMVAGLRKLVLQSGKVLALDTEVVCENDEFDYQGGTSPSIRFRKCLKGERGKPYAVYSSAVLTGGAVSIEVMRWDEVMRLAKDSPIWKQHQGEMARKTCFRRHYKSLPSSAEAQSAFEAMDDLYQDEAGDTQPGEISEPAPRHGSASARLRAVANQPAEPAHDPETGEVTAFDELPPADDPF